MAKTAGKNESGWLRKPTLPASPVRLPGNAPKLLVSGCTDTGRVRQNNEDTFRCEDGGLYVVCDGMGGMAAGEVASQAAADAFVREFFHAAAAPLEDGSIRERLARAIAAANREVLRAAQEPGRTGMGTTLVAAALEGEQMVVANVGDSRAYLLHEGVCRQITRDHSFANELQQIAGFRPEEISPVYLQRFGALITRAIGAAAEVEPEFFSLPFEPGDVLLLASDGLTRYFEQPAALVPFLNAADLPGSCRALIDAANGAGGVDNITALLLSRDRSLPY